MAIERDPLPFNNAKLTSDFEAVIFLGKLHKLRWDILRIGLALKLIKFTSLGPYLDGQCGVVIKDVHFYYTGSRCVISHNIKREVS